MPDKNAGIYVTLKHTTSFGPFRRLNLLSITGYSHLHCFKFCLYNNCLIGSRLVLRQHRLRRRSTARRKMTAVNDCCVAPPSMMRHGLVTWTACRLSSTPSLTWRSEYTLVLSNYQIWGCTFEGWRHKVKFVMFTYNVENVTNYNITLNIVNYDKHY